MLRTLIASAAMLALAAPAFAAGPLVDPAELDELRAEGGVVLLDMRPVAKKRPSAYETGHIPGAISAPLDKAGWVATRDGVPVMLPDPASFEASMRALGIDDGERVVLIHDGSKPDVGDVYQSTRAYWSLVAMGHDAVSILDGGQAAWVAAGLPLETAPASPDAPGDFTARHRPDMVVEAADVAAAIASDVKLLDSRPRKYFIGEAKHPAAKAAGTIPTAINLNFADLMEGTKFKSAEQIRDRMETAGFAPDDAIIAFCNTATGCSGVWVAAVEVAGYRNITLYDGSMIDWTRDESRPVAIGN